MKKEMQQQQEQSHTFVKGVNNFDYSKNTQDIEEVEGTPFKIITNNEKQTYFIAIGNNRVSEETNDKEALIEEIKNNDWMLAFRMTAVVAEQVMLKLQEKQTGEKQ